MAEPSTGCFDRFWMSLFAVVVAITVTVSAVIVSTNRVSAQESDWSKYSNGSLYLISPVRGQDNFTLVEPPTIKDGFFCAVVAQFESELCVPLTNVAGITPV